MAIDTPARIAVLGAGPIGLEAALYARFLGYDVDIYERGGPCENILGWGRVRLFSPFGLNRSTLGLAAIRAQTPTWEAPDDEALLTGRQTVERYFLPLSQTDLLAESLHEKTEVVAIGREDRLKGDLVGDASRADTSFCILTCDGNGKEHTHSSDVVIDATGTYGHPNWLGQGGIPAVGEHAAQKDIEYRLPDILGEDRSRYALKHVLLVGSGYSAATSVVALAELAGEVQGTQITWVTRCRAGSDPIARIGGDRLAERERLAQAANRLAAGNNSSVTHWAGTTVKRIERITGDSDGDGGDDADQGRFRVELVGEHAGMLEVDRILAHVGYRPDAGLYQELQVHACYATEGPMKLAAALPEKTSADCLAQTSPGPQSLLTPEPDFYILGAKSYGRSSKFLISLGLSQIRDLFTIIGESEDLDLYKSITKQTSMDLASMTEKSHG